MIRNEKYENQEKKRKENGITWKTEQKTEGGIKKKKKITTNF